MRLNLGCGKDYKKDCLNVDVAEGIRVQVRCDLNSFPYPFRDGCCDVAYLIDVLEHLDQPFKVMEEVYRISENGGKVIVRVPHFSSVWAYADFGHIHAFSHRAFNDLTGATNCSFETKARFEILRKRIGFNKTKWRFWNYVVEPMVNSSDVTKEIYEETLLRSIFPAGNIYVEMVALKH